MFHFNIFIATFIFNLLLFCVLHHQCEASTLRTLASGAESCGMEKIIFTFALLLSTIFLGEAARSAEDDDYGHDSYIRMLEAVEQARARIQNHLNQKEVIQGVDTKFKMQV